MKYEIVEIDELSGGEATIYSVIMEGDNVTLFDRFVQENATEYRREVSFIIDRLQEIGNTTGTREKFFKHKEGRPGDGVCALYDAPDSHLRLYCIRYGNVAIILGGGGPKPDEVRAWQDSAKLKIEAETMMEVSKDIMQRLKGGEIQWSPDGSQLLGNLNISDNEQ
ncbi:MAG TPA: hypothetical protein VF939_26060 [Puia sp.]